MENGVVGVRPPFAFLDGLITLRSTQGDCAESKLPPRSWEAEPH